MKKENKELLKSIVTDADCIDELLKMQVLKSIDSEPFIFMPHLAAALLCVFEVNYDLSILLTDKKTQNSIETIEKFLIDSISKNKK